MGILALCGIVLVIVPFRVVGCLRRTKPADT
jgi:hypothetical protein